MDKDLLQNEIKVSVVENMKPIAFSKLIGSPNLRRAKPSFRGKTLLIRHKDLL